MSQVKRGNTPYWCYGTGNFAKIHDDLKESKAYRCLKPTEKIILLDMIRVYARASHSGTNGISEGFPYTFSMCKEDISESSFQKGIRTLIDKGFFSAPPTIQDNRPSSPRRYRQSHDWTKYEPMKEETRKLDGYNFKKKNRLRGKARRLTDFRAGHKTK